VKIDVEGFEFEVLKGMEKLLGIHQPVMIIKYSPSLNNVNDATIDPLFALLPSGYRLLQIFYDGYSDKYRLEAISKGHVLADTVEIVAFPGWLDVSNGSHLSQINHKS
jgi:hypothetical protein